MRSELATERSEKERLQKRLKNMQDDQEYLRNSYQLSSNLAAEHAAEAQSLQAEVDKLKVKAGDNIVRIHEININNEIEAHLRRIKQLQLEKEELIRELEKRGEELKALTNGRRGTRGTSVQIGRAHV